MGWPLTVPAEVARSRDDAPAKMILPYSIHHHARGERVFGISQYIGEGGPAPGRVPAVYRNDLCRVRVQNREKPWLHFFLRFLETPSAQHKSRWRLGAQVRHSSRYREFAGIHVGELCQLSFQILPPLLFLAFYLSRNGGFVRDILARSGIEILMRFPCHLLFKRIPILCRFFQDRLDFSG